MSDMHNSSIKPSMAPTHRNQVNQWLPEARGLGKWGGDSGQSVQTSSYKINKFWGSNGTPLQYSCLENPTDGGAWWAAVHGVSESDTTDRLYFHFSLSCIGEGNGNPLQCSCLENPRDRRAWWAAVSGVAQSRTRLKRLSSSSSSSRGSKVQKGEYRL